jgi:hypothetical protein
LIAMLERLLTFWKGTLFVLTLLGFAVRPWVSCLPRDKTSEAMSQVSTRHICQ